MINGYIRLSLIGNINLPAGFLCGNPTHTGREENLKSAGRKSSLFNCLYAFLVEKQLLFSFHLHE